MARTTRERYDAIAAQLADLVEETISPVSRRATAAALLYHKLRDVSWVGFYMLSEGRLDVDAYQGPVACLTLAPHRGVCWAAVDRREPVIVPDVSEFPGHIPCDARTRSELVVPLFDVAGSVVGVLDADSTRLARFVDADATGLAKIARIVLAANPPGRRQQL